jgi:hypothetical protein
LIKRRANSHKKGAKLLRLAVTRVFTLPMSL